MSRPRRSPEEIAEIKADLRFVMHQFCAFFSENHHPPQCRCKACCRKISRSHRQNHAANGGGVDLSAHNYTNQHDTEDPVTQPGYSAPPAVGSTVVLTSDGECLFASNNENKSNIKNSSGKQQTEDEQLGKKGPMVTLGFEDEECGSSFYEEEEFSDEQEFEDNLNLESANANDIASHRRRQDPDAQLWLSRGRGKSQQWVKVRTFNTVEEAEAYAREEKWAYRSTNNTAEGKKRYLRCPYATPTIAPRDRCPSERYLLYPGDSNKVEMYWNKQPHRHKAEPNAGARGKSQTWQKLSVFSDEDAANTFIEDEGWSQIVVNHTSEGRKRYLRCPLGAAGPSCQAQRYLLFKPDTAEVELYWNGQEHRHSATVSGRLKKRGMKRATKEYVHELFRSGIRKPRFVLEHIHRKGLPEPRLSQIIDYLKFLRRKYNPVFGRQSANSSKCKDD